MVIMKIIIIFNYVVGRDFLSVLISIEQPKFKEEFKKTIILHPKCTHRPIKCIEPALHTITLN
jgi:hypothetical protein